MDYDDVIRDAAKAIQNVLPQWLAEDGTTDDEDLARAAAPILMEYGARLMRDAGPDADPATIVREAVK